MEYKVLSGVLVPTSGHRANGSTIIRFKNHYIEDDALHHHDLDPKDWKHLNLDKSFRQDPCVTVALRRVTFIDRDVSPTGRSVSAQRKDFNLGTVFVGENDGEEDDGSRGLKVSWRTQGEETEVREISYMIMGEVD